jgi:hypothetical protein
MLDFAIRRRLPAFDEMDPQLWMGGMGVINDLW